MPKFEIFRGPFTKTDEPVRLILRQTADGVVVSAVDDKGELLNCGNIVTLMENGTLLRNPCCFVPGLTVDDRRRIKLAE